MKTLEDIQERFAQATEKEHWERLKVLLFSEDKENVVMGMNLLETLDEEVYYDGICTFLNDDGNGNWTLNPDLGCENDLALKVEILRLAEEDIEHEIKEGFDGGFLEEMFVGVCGEIEVSELSESQKERLLSKVCEMVEVKGEEGRFLVMKYQVTQALWESVTGNSPSGFKGASRPVEQVSWFDCIDFANLLSEREGLEKVYERDSEEVKMNFEANGYRLPTEAEWEYAARGGEDYTYAGSNNVDEVGWYYNNSGRKTHGVGQKKSNGYGLYDMSGNVFEWCFDKWSNDSSSRVLRGGSWYYSAGYCEVSYRDGHSPSARLFDRGVRFFRSVPLNS